MTAPDTLPPELAELGELLREDPPRPDADWARELDTRAAAGFPRPPRRSPWAIFKAHRRVLVPVVGFACVALLAVGVVASQRDGYQELSGTFSSEDAGGGGSAASSGGAGGSSEGADAAAPVMGREPASGSSFSDARRTRAVERNAALTLAARRRDIEKVAAGVLRVTDAAGGFVASSTVSTGSGSFELRIPTRRLGKALADLSRLAKVRERTQSSQDITAQTVSARERLREKQREREGLLRALGNATTLNETEAVKARLRTVNREIASARASLRRVVNRANYANVSVELVTDRGGSAVPADDGRWTPADALHDAARVLEVVAGVAVVALALLLPFALIGVLVMLTARATGRRRRERALDMA